MTIQEIRNEEAKVGGEMGISALVPGKVLKRNCDPPRENSE